MPRKYILPIFLVVQIILIQIVSQFPESVERYYSNGIFVPISKMLRILFGWIPFAVGDIIYFIVIFIIIRWFWKKRKTWRISWKDNLLLIVSGISLFYFLFHFLWALNYHRVKLHDKLGIGTEYTDAELVEFTKRLIVKTNEIHNKIEAADSLKVVFPYSREIVFEKNRNGYDHLAKEYPIFLYEKPSVKNSIISLPLTVMGFAGYLNPFTNEANVNEKLPMYTFPATANHEMAHQIGYASESEANFIGFLASIKNDDLYIQYSGYTLALRYCLRSIEIRDERQLEALLPTINYGILMNIKESNDFWEQYQSFIEQGFEFFYHNFLKMNRQEEGMESYSRFVDLMVNYYTSQELG